MERFRFNFGLACYGIELSLPVLCMHDACMSECVFAMDQPKLGNAEKFEFQAIFGLIQRKSELVDIKMILAQLLLFLQKFYTFFFQNRRVNRFNRAQCDDAGCYSYVVIGRQNKFF